MRKLQHAALGVRNIDLTQQFNRALVGLAGLDMAVGHLAFDDLAPDRQDRVQGGGRVLEHHADITAPGLSQCLGVKRGEFHTIQLNRALHLGTRGQQAADSQRGDALARARLSNNAQHLVGTDLKVNATNRRHRTARTDKGDL